MAYAKTVMQGGISAGSALAIGGGVATGLTAAGTTQGTALTLGALDAHMIATCAANAGVVLTAGAAGDSAWIFNGGVSTCTVYPPSGAKFNALSTNGGFSLATNTVCICKCISATQWMAALSA